MLRRLQLVFLLALLLAAGRSGPASTAAPHPCGALKRPPRVYEHVLLIALENHSYGQIAGSSPYLNGLAQQCGLAANYVAITHPSLPNYLALTSGSTNRIKDDCTSCSTDAHSIFEQLGSGWRSYEEHLPRTGYKGATSGSYAKKHNPAAYYRRIAAAFRTQDVPLGTTRSGPLARDLRQNRLPRFSFITPDLCHDEHDCSIASGDAWLKRWIPIMLAAPGYRKGGTVLLITYDEGTLFDNRVYSVVVSPYTGPGTVARTGFSHYSLLKTIEDLLGVRCLANACATTTASMRAAFRL
jgi:phospholipase C